MYTLALQKIHHSEKKKEKKILLRNHAKTIQCENSAIYNVHNTVSLLYNINISILQCILHTNEQFDFDIFDMFDMIDYYC